MLSVGNRAHQKVRLPIASMLQRRQILSFVRQFGLISLLLAPAVAKTQDRALAYETPVTFVSERLPAETVITADVGVLQLDANTIIGAAMCFAVGFGACLLVVHYMLPSLVHAQCVEIVREYLDHTRREADIRVVVLDRDSHEPLQRQRRVAAPTNEEVAAPNYESQQYLRVDKPKTSSNYVPTMPTTTHSEEAPNAVLSQVYEQNLHLRDQLRKQSRSVRQ
jgi:hypothetical protein